ncbi:hypothetical protein RRG08_052792 [Elysia crispata]|uniref:Uncharacterized protein n=1 Tax=Elysia crispata TaxID=231223 RepID=A0AAE1B5T1_9GAST|nr:hypothetical protein RRG08_052792 [Elysia crispata]
MGVPKFYRWISERYPCLSEVVKEFQLPEFDNLYLDMNGIIHVCSHPDDDNPHFRITEEAIFKNICHYIDFLYRMIKPRKVFFMAVDGVAPRAKMNQQRGRRFRSAREAEQNEKKAQERGEVLPTEKRFDSNCITPGTPFMVRLQTHLKYFVVNKITNDPLWQGRRIFLSGHETPGEGEHKVMDFIRYSKSQPDYDPDTRHCLYGLDADLIMLGLVSHEPRFSLLREEVRFGGKKDKSNKRPVTPEETTFHLLHLSLLRDYLGYEFADLEGKTSFAWDLEKLIDDWVLMGFLVGNDFIPHLPHLHIHHDALPLLWRTYKKVMPSLDGYLNEGGHLNLRRFEKFMEELSKFDIETFESAFSDLSYLEGKLGGKSINESAGTSRTAQARYPKPKLKELKPFKMKQNGNAFAALEDDCPLDPISDIVDEDSDDDEDEDEEDESSADDEDDEDCNTFDDEFRLHKRDYYMNKMAYTSVTSEVIKEQAQGYVIAIQWILLYYFEGCPSWSWFYSHHYAPYISDIQGFSDLKISFDLSTPFLPFQQLMAVLPAASKDLLPLALQPLMIEESSPVLDFYPVRFDTDLNGKQQDWEAVVLIPFIDENRLLTAMSSREHLLSKEERLRNGHGPHLLYEYSSDNQGFYPSSIPGVLPDLNMNKAKLTEIDKHTFHIDANRLRKGLLDATRLNVYFPGFPALRFLPHTFGLAKAGVKVFQHCSRGENMVLRVQAKENLILEKLADELLGKETYVGWPHLHEARVTAVANESYKIVLVEELSKKGKKEATLSFDRRPLDENEARIVAREAEHIKEKQMDRFAIDVGKTEVVVYASALTGRSYTFGLHGAIALSKQFASKESPYLYQMTVKDVEVEESAVTVLKTLDEVFPKDSPVFMVGNPHYSAQGTVLEVLPDMGRVRIVLDVTEEPDFTQMSRTRGRNDYVSNIHAAQHIGIDGHLMSRITGSIFVEKSHAEAGQKGKVNIGLNLKFTKKMEEVPGYTKKLDKGWFYSWKCVEQVEDYVNTFRDLWWTVQTLKDERDVFSEDKLFPEGSAKTLADVQEYLEKLPCSRVPRMPFGSQILDEDKVKDIEKMTATLNKVPDKVKIKVKPRLLFRPLANQGTLVPDPEADFQLYDRVVVVKTGYSVPFGQRGTLIGVPSGEDGVLGPHSLYDIVFDKQFAGGITLRCSPGKGYRVPGSAMLNLTFGEFRKNTPRTSNSSTSSGGYNNNNTRDGLLGKNPWQLHTNEQSGGIYLERKLPQQQLVKWDARGQPQFGKIFGSQEQPRSGNDVAQPKFVTPKVQGAQPVKVSRVQEPSKRADNLEFDNMWRNLQSHKTSKQGTSKGSRLSGPDILKQAISVLPPTANQSSNLTSTSGKSLGSNLVLAQSPDSKASPRLLHHPIPQRLSQSSTPDAHQTVATAPIAVLQKPGSGDKDKDSSVPAAVQSLFDSATKVQNYRQKPMKANPTPENAEFLAMFNSLKTQSSELLKASKDNKAESDGISGNSLPNKSKVAEAETKPKSQADLALKQLLKIGVAQSGGLPEPEAGSSQPHATSEALGHISPRQEPATSELGPPAYGRQVSLQELFEEVNKQKQQRSQQEPQLHQPPPSLAGSGPAENRNPIAEIEAFCQAAFNKGEVHFDFKLQPKQNAYIATVSLPNGHKYEGSVCKIKQDAAKSAASMALLCLKTSQAQATHPVITGSMPGAGQRGPLMNRFFSPNSAFRAIGMQGPNPALLQASGGPAHPPPILLTPQHFFNQPPPALPGTPLHQLLQQQQQQHKKQQQMQALPQNRYVPVPPQSLHQQLQHPPPTHFQTGQSQHPTAADVSGQSKQGLESKQPAVLQAEPEPKIPPVSHAGSSLSVNSFSQQFIPLQVTKRQKKKEAADSSVSLTSPASDVANKTRSSPEQREENLDKPASDVVGIESPHTSLNSSVDVKSSMILEQTDASNTLGVKATSPVQSKPNLVILEKNEADQLVPSSSKSKPELKSSLTVGPDSKPDLKPMSTVPSAVPNSKPAKKRKSRLAANFGPRS